MKKSIILLIGLLALIIGCKSEETCTDFFNEYGLEKEYTNTGVIVYGNEFISGNNGALIAEVKRNGVLVNNAECSGYLINLETYSVDGKNLQLTDDGKYSRNVMFDNVGKYNYSVICTIDGEYFGEGYDYICVR